MKSKYKISLQILLVVVILFGGIVVMKKLVSMRKPPTKKPPQIMAPLLKGKTVHTVDMQMEVVAFGTVQPKLQAQIVPQVSGLVVQCHSDFVNGGFFKAGQCLISIDPRDYEFAVQNSEAAVARAQVQLDQELAEAEVARREWQQLNPESQPSSPLVLRKPHIQQAKAQLKAAQAQLATAKLNLERTEISMPFDGRVASKSVDPGQFITAGQPVATVYGTAVVEIIFPLEDRELAWFDLPLGYTDDNTNRPSAVGADVVVRANFAGGRHSWDGKIVRTHGQIDPASQMVTIVAEVADPFKLVNHRPPLVPGMFVEIIIKGKHLQNVIPVPRYAVHDRGHVWVASDGRLYIKEVKIARRDKGYAYIISGIKDGDVIVTSPLDTVTDGMKVRIFLDSGTDAAEELSR